MPANKKYLAESSGQKIVSLFNGFIGGYLLSQSFHLLFGLFFDEVNVIVVSVFTMMLVWPTFMVLAFLIKPRWLCSLIYFGSSFLIMSIAYNL